MEAFFVPVMIILAALLGVWLGRKYQKPLNAPANPFEVDLKAEKEAHKKAQEDLRIANKRLAETEDDYLLVRREVGDMQETTVPATAREALSLLQKMNAEDKGNMEVLKANPAVFDHINMLDTSLNLKVTRLSRYVSYLNGFFSNQQYRLKQSGDRAALAEQRVELISNYVNDLIKQLQVARDTETSLSIRSSDLAKVLHDRMIGTLVELAEKIKAKDFGSVTKNAVAEGRAVEAEKRADARVAEAEKRAEIANQNIAEIAKAQAASLRSGNQGNTRQSGQGQQKQNESKAKQPAA